MQKILSVFVVMIMVVALAAMTTRDADTIETNDALTELCQAAGAGLFKCLEVGTNTVRFKENVSDSCYNQFFWDVGDGSGTHSGSPYTHTYSSSGDYDITFQAGGFNCTPAVLEELPVTISVN